MFEEFKANRTIVTIDFDKGFTTGAQTPDFLSAYGIPSVTFSGAPGAMGPWIWDHTSGNSIVPSEPNYLMQNCSAHDAGQIHRLTFLFSPELKEFSLIRVGRFGGSSTDPWTAQFFNASHVELGSFGESALLINQPPKKFTFTAPAGETIARMDLESVYWAATTATVPVDDFVLVYGANQTIDFPNPGPQIATNKIGLSATASSGLPVTFAVTSGPGEINEETNLIFTGVGTVVVVALQEGDENWNPAPNVTNSITIYPLIHYVSLSGGHVSPFTDWSTAATNIQAAIDVADAGDLVLVTNGVYDTGERVMPGASLNNRIVVTNAIIVCSVNGPSNTVILGQGPTGDDAVRCVYLTNGAVLCGFTLSNGYTRTSGDYLDVNGGGVYAEGAVVINCLITGSLAYYGGGAYGGTLNNCVLSGNSAYSGGGACYGTLNNCTLSGNSAYSGGGVINATLYNCIVYYNSPNPYSSCTLHYCCTMSDPGGIGNITNEPMFVDRAAGNLRLLSNSPCINAGTNQNWMVGAVDLDSNSRIYGGGRVDMGAYEYQGSLSVISTNWLAQYGLPIDGSADWGDADGDGMDNWREWRCHTDPTNGISLLDLIEPFAKSASEGEGIVLR